MCLVRVREWGPCVNGKNVCFYTLLAEELLVVCGFFWREWFEEFGVVALYFLVEFVFVFSRVEVDVEMVYFEYVLWYEWAVVLAHIASREVAEEFFLELNGGGNKFVKFGFGEFCEALDVAFGYDEGVSGHESRIAENNGNKGAFVNDAFFCKSTEWAVHARGKV